SLIRFNRVGSDSSNFLSSNISVLSGPDVCFTRPDLLSNLALDVLRDLIDREARRLWLGGSSRASVCTLRSRPPKAAKGLISLVFFLMSDRRHRAQSGGSEKKE